MNTDLYKYAMWSQPFTSSDLASLEHEPIRVETPEGSPLSGALRRR